MRHQLSLVWILDEAMRVLDKMPKAVQSKAKATIHDMW